MLTIDREPIYKNKFFLGGVAVISGFVLTMGVIRLTNPVDNTTNQSTQSTSDGRAASLIPISASGSESSPEGSSGDSASSDAPANGAVSSVAPTSSSKWPTGGTQAAKTQPTASSSSAAPQPSSSAGSGSASGSTPTASTRGNSQEGSQCDFGTSPLGLPVLGTIVNGVCKL